MSSMKQCKRICLTLLDPNVKAQSSDVTRPSWQEVTQCHPISGFGWGRGERRRGGRSPAKCKAFARANHLSYELPQKVCPPSDTQKKDSLSVCLGSLLSVSA